MVNPTFSRRWICEDAIGVSRQISPYSGNSKVASKRGNDALIGVELLFA